MTLMNVMDSVFYLGLVITFLLILLVVYHFKNRVTTMEQRCDTMFEIMNNIVQELNLLRRQQNMTMGGGIPVNITTTTVEQEHVYPEENDDEEVSEYETDDESSYLSEDDLEEDLEPENKVVELENENILMESPLPDATQSSLLDIDDNNSIKIEKVENTLENEDEPIDDSSTMESYKSMTNSALKALVIDKGLSTNPSKLKKSELLDLLKELE
jgi:hypothetical protein|tara:strand:- start:2572 stop:3213 length:642 start_codon:yes stop_codon:yes gene_type:complete